MIKSICPQVVSKMVLHLHAQQQIFPALIRGSSIRHCSSDIKKVTIRNRILFQIAYGKRTLKFDEVCSNLRRICCFPYWFRPSCFFRKTSKKTRTTLPSESSASTCFYMFVSFTGLAKFLLSSLCRHCKLIFVLWKFYLSIFNNVVFNFLFLIVILISTLYKCVMGFWIFNI